jgi:aminopeptidase-like protein
MNCNELKPTIDPDTIGSEIYRLVQELYPICRSITGNGVRETLRVISNHIELKVHEIPSGTKVFDWTVPKEWNIRDAYVRNSKGEKIVDFTKSNLHVVNYSVPVHKRIQLKELKDHLFTIPGHPDWIPYRHSFYNESWGFCLSHRQLMQLDEDLYEVCIDSSLKDGHLTFAECYLPGARDDEVLISCHTCHPSLCNDNLSGVAIAVFLAKHLAALMRQYSFRFVFLPTTIGSITWLALNEQNLFRIRHGLVLACLGDSGKSTYKKSRQGDTEIDRVATHVLKHSGDDYDILDFSPYGYDERQFCSPGFNLPMGCMMRTPNGRYAQYHTSADDLNFVQPSALADSFIKIMEIFTILENNRTFTNQNPKCEPQLGRRGLYRAVGEQNQSAIDQMALLWVLNLSDGSHSLLDIAERAGVVFDAVCTAAKALLQHNLLQYP